MCSTRKRGKNKKELREMKRMQPKSEVEGIPRCMVKSRPGEQSVLCGTEH
jgi:hypothetical protein